MFVLDSSAVLTVCLGEPEFAVRAERIIRSLESQTALVPPVFWLEVPHVLLKEERGRRFTKAEVDKILSWLEKLPLELDSSGPSADFVRFARKHNLSAYDASYLELAIRRQAPLASFDKNLCAAAKSEGVELFDGLEAG